MDFDLFIRGAAVFAAVFALDFVWAFYTKAINESAASRAALWAMILIVMSGISQIGYTHDWRLLVPAALGALSGTFLAVKIHARGTAAAKE